MHVISASRRTDIPAFYSRWLMNRVRAGWCAIRNPFSGEPYRVSLAPADVIAFVFWTRNPLPLLRDLDVLDGMGFRYYFLFTITGYDRMLDPEGLSPERAMETFRRLSDRIGPEFVCWRYDPIMLSDRTDAAYHRLTFSRLCDALAGSTRCCIISFLQLYRKTRRRMDAAAGAAGFRYGFVPANSVPAPERGHVLALEEKRALAADLGAIASAHDIRIEACCSESLVDPDVNIYPAHCVDADLIARLRPDLQVRLDPRPTREGCGCFASRDIGAYDTCAHGCVYCYATCNPAAARAYLMQHDPEAPMLGPDTR